MSGLKAYDVDVDVRPGGIAKISSECVPGSLRKGAEAYGFVATLLIHAPDKLAAHDCAESAGYTVRRVLPHAPESERPR